MALDSQLLKEGFGPPPIGTKFLFLDIDGVLNSTDWWIRRNAMHEAGTMPMYSQIHQCSHHRDQLDPEAVERLNRIIRESQARVVVSSTWRNNRTIEELQFQLADVGFLGEVVGKTPSFQGDRERGLEIQKWLDQWAPCSPFVILDDDGDMAHLQSRWVWTPNPVGLQDHHVDIALGVLKYGCSSQTSRMAHLRDELGLVLREDPHWDTKRSAIWREIRDLQKELGATLAGGSKGPRQVSND